MAQPNQKAIDPDTGRIYSMAALRVLDREPFLTRLIPLREADAHRLSSMRREDRIREIGKLKTPSL